MTHPQPAFDFLMSLPTNTDVDESIFIDWWAYESIDAEKGDDIRNHPEIWEECLELPKRLEELSTDNYVSVQPFNGSINLNALAIGLGLENAKYKPDTFAGLEYTPSQYNATVFVFPRGVLFSIGNVKESVINSLQYTKHELEDLGLDQKASFDGNRQTSNVSNFVSDHNPQ